MLTFLKLGGSLITDKEHAFTARREKIDLLAGEIAAAYRAEPGLKLVLGHGSGSFGHEAAAKHHTRQGVTDDSGWHGFAEVWYQASLLNRMVMDSLHGAGVPAVTISPLASITAHDGRLFIWDIYPLQRALQHGLTPVVQGDAVFDDVRGGTILSTEDQFEYLAHRLRPARILLAGREMGVWQDFPARDKIIPAITPAELPAVSASLGPASGQDVTGGMAAKVTRMLALVETIEGLEVCIFSGDPPGNVQSALLGENPGTRLHG